MTESTSDDDPGIDEQLFYWIIALDDLHRGLAFVQGTQHVRNEIIEMRAEMVARLLPMGGEWAGMVPR